MKSWYSRNVLLPQEYYDKNIFLKIKNVGAHCARVFVNNELVDTRSWVSRFEQGILNDEYIDISKYNKENTIKLDIELFFKDDKFKKLTVLLFLM